MGTVKNPGILQAIGNTPLVELRHIDAGPEVRLFAKLEGRNPSGSVKDRIALAMVMAAQREGRLRPGDTLVAASTGNTSIALAMVGRVLGYRVVVVMPENIAPEVAAVALAFGAAIHWVPQKEGMAGTIAAAQQLALGRGWQLLDQFADRSNPNGHYESTGGEILADIDRVDAFVAGLGTGGTLMGVGQRLKEANPSCRVVAVEPHPGQQVQGLRSLAEGFVPPLLDLALLDGKILVRSSDAFRACSELMRKEAIFAGVSSGAVLHAAFKVAQRIERGNVVLLFADGGWKYLSTQLWTVDQPNALDEELDDVFWW
jgi:cysteine synthase B